jgi:hypothetical protein
MRSENDIQAAGQSGFGPAGLLASVWDIAGGYIPGRGGNAGQAWANVGFGFIEAPVGIIRTGVGLGADLGHGDFLDATMDAFSLGSEAAVSQLGRQATKIWNWKGVEQSGQQEFISFVQPEVANLARFSDNFALWFKRTSQGLGVAWDVNEAVNESIKENNPSSGGSTSEKKTALIPRPQPPQIPIKDIEPERPDEIKKKKPDIFPPPWEPPPPQPSLVGDDPFDPGGGGRILGSGGPPGPGGGALTLSNIGGISLRGAGDALKQLGQLQGVALDKNGQLVLISKADGEIGLPPLRLDDVVTAFRSVYMHGESPFVSIDPNPADPHGPIMLTAKVLGDQKRMLRVLARRQTMARLCDESLPRFAFLYCWLNESPPAGLHRIAEG